MLAIDSMGNKLLEFINVSEEEAPLKYTPMGSI